MKRALPAFLILQALAGCDATQPVRQVVSEVRTVEVPKVVKVPCIELSEIPPHEPSAMPDPDDKSIDIGRFGAGAKADGIALLGENRKLRAALIQCTKLPSTTGDTNEAK